MRMCLLNSMRYTLQRAKSSLTPFPIIFIPDSIFLVRKMKFKLFYDIGYTEPWDPLKRMRAAGTSLILPLGGDVIGAGTLILSQFSVTSVFYTEYHGIVSRTPRIFFDISGVRVPCISQQEFFHAIYTSPISPLYYLR